MKHHLGYWDRVLSEVKPPGEIHGKWLHEKIGNARRSRLKKKVRAEAVESLRRLCLTLIEIIEKKERGNDRRRTNDQRDRPERG